MIERVEVRNYQSLKKVDLDLGRLTVIVGASSSGKSALIRAFKALASNMRGASAITRGQKATAITVRTEDHTVTLERTESSGTYRLVTADGKEHVFTKLNGGVPEHVTAALRIEPVPANGSSVNFAGQFDKPYLLDDTGANVARSLGELTNVTTIFEAVRAANKVRLASSASLKARQSDLVSLKARAKQYAGLQERLLAFGHIEELALKAEELEAYMNRLQHAIETLEIAEGVLSRVKTLPEVPDGEVVTVALTRLQTFRQILNGITRAAHDEDQYSDRILERQNEENTLNQTLLHVLRDAGTCPTCGQTTV